MSEKRSKVLMSGEFLKQSGYLFLSLMDTTKEIIKSTDDARMFEKQIGGLIINVVEIFDEICKDLSVFTEEEMKNKENVKKVFTDKVSSKTSVNKGKAKELDKKIEMLKELKDVLTKLEEMI